MELLMYLGLGITVIGAIWFLIAAFSESLLWGLGCLFLGPVSIAFLFIHWQDAKTPFFVQLGGIGLVLVGVMLGGGTTT